VSAAGVAGPVCVSCLTTPARWAPARLVVHQHLALDDAAAAAADVDVTFDSSPQMTSDLSKSQFRRAFDTVFYDETTRFIRLFDDSGDFLKVYLTTILSLLVGHV